MKKEQKKKQTEINPLRILVYAIAIIFIAHMLLNANVDKQRNELHELQIENAEAVLEVLQYYKQEIESLKEENIRLQETVNFYGNAYLQEVFG